VSAGELLHNAGILEQQLQNIFATAKHWNALLLLDEADVFLETRTERNHFMNGIVAVFLRMLEWFEGVMFLTTNRASHFDPAILSRIHIMVEYPGLKQDQRMGIWKSSLDRARTAQGPSDLSDEEVAKLAKLEINGRQVFLSIFFGGHGSSFILDR
jgi:SpoVK/Ycf46/Vps4 family AAA+-type ATPase